MMTGYPARTWGLAMALLAALSQNAAAASVAPLAEPALPTPMVPNWPVVKTFEQLGHASDSLLLGVRNSEQIDFGLRRDRLATDASLQLDYTPSPALLPNLSHLRVYLNDELMGVVPVEKDQLGQRVRRQLAMDPKLLSDFNRVRLEFVGHYTDICEDPAHSGLWLNLNRKSQVQLHEQALVLDNDLAYFPLPFFDARDTGKVELPVVFSGVPSLGEQRAAAILASYFGSQAGWRKASFPVLYNRLPARCDKPTPSIVFASNDRRPAFLADLQQFPPVDGPVLQMIDHPDDRFSKVLLVLGRNDDDLVKAASALAVGNYLFRGARVKVEQMTALQPRQPYDAPNWTRTDRPVRFAELLDYPEQLQVSGLQPRPVTLELNLPPDLFVWRNQGIPLRTLYRYTAPAVTDESRLSISVNDQYITSMPLVGNDRRGGTLEEMRLAVLSGDNTALTEKSLVPALKMGDRNRLRFDFSFASTLGSAQRDRCQTSLPVDVRAAIDDNSTIDLSGYHHYIAMPDLRAFARSGFPFSRMADLSETLVIMPAKPTAMQVGTLLDSVGGLAGQVGYPALAVRLTDDWKQAAAADADLLLIGSLPEALGDAPNLGLLLSAQRDWLLQGRSARLPGGQRFDTEPVAASSRVAVSAQAPIAAITGLKSPFHEQRSVVALLANSDSEYALLRDVLGDVGKLDAVAGSVTLVRSSGVSSQFVGEHYFVGSLPWWLLLWFHLSEHPVWLAVIAAVCVVLFAFLLWQALRWAGKRRLGEVG
ncbi:cellulose biosynthesis cyclic di-GMP-binding regulatory protein BcsB [Pseudomonas monteilii]|uniref:cellulose biosynthesis cyclic di-GMP-binding regulatory protein BcsB n=1 Tax=Pseudomonas monteilii TaxID=76759 RepID=UPI001CBB96B8|nr:cellulose biosynthesis cyclic di-GMP-binding regulatory protein BcsB [Pseudomonas monteilii]MBZ3665158.1 cellulose biosynthesis cyclic di-GMP-binding regulatory protein BcsB [Pseudomonas monteilii]MBZ3670503.1 cellulose biosynthesis cyclic di-GMP-binding regulatory protein BcsB [Pseudomonas monteilii]